jgi:hypothetical protein
MRAVVSIKRISPMAALRDISLRRLQGLFLHAPMGCPLILGSLLHRSRDNRGKLRFLLPLAAAILLRTTIVFAGTQVKTIVDLQPFRTTASARFQDKGGQTGVATLIDLNPNVGAWYLLKLARPGEAEEIYHIENPAPLSQEISLEEGSANGLVITAGSRKVACPLWGPEGDAALRQAHLSGDPFAPLCGGRLYLRNSAKGHSTPIESVTAFLRYRIPGGDKVVSFVRDTFFAYLYEKKAEKSVVSASGEGQEPVRTAEGPVPALMAEGQAGRAVKPLDLGIDIEGSGPSGMSPGAWYAARGIPGVYASVLVPSGIAPGIMRSYPNIVGALDTVEMEELVYLVAFDLALFDLHYAVGTDAPGVVWSSHMRPDVKNSALPGPDGIGSSAPLVRTGIISPRDAAGAVATFTGGFKRYHGAFKYGDLSLKNHGSHYGFLEDGVLFSTLQPGLATVYALTDGLVDMKTWTNADDDLLPKMASARQNGVPIIQGFEAGRSVPGALVAKWGAGNWSGSGEEKLKTMRAAAALQETAGKRFLIYAFFWSATPSAMARVFQAYQCSYAMLIDMNALVHTYLAVYRREEGRLYVEHLITGMSQDDIPVKGHYIPRFLGFSDDRDFFYLTRKEKP